MLKSAVPVLVAAALLASGCGTAVAVRALRPGESELTVSAGGPVARVAGMNIPVPYAVARYRHGLDERLGLYDVGGRLVQELASEERAPGRYEVSVGLPAGIYFCRLEALSFRDSRKLTISR
ncbi:hypothetical protein FJY71_08735 [candidate division WOR-3 bacterium]|nr:hypothetical protein [candidate division WOR-3 bacterium]